MSRTILEHRLIAALILCLSGLALVPFDLLPSRVFGWEQLGGVYDRIFEDGFEEGNTDLWKGGAPQNFRLFFTHEEAEFRQEYRLDQDLAAQFGDRGAVLLAGFTHSGEPAFSTEMRATEQGLEVRLGAALDGERWLAGEWQRLLGDPVLTIEWQQGHPLAEDGFLYLLLDGRLQAWLTDLDNDSLRLETIAITKSGAQTLLNPIPGSR